MRKSYRVKRERDFQQVFHKGQSCANRNFIVYQISKPQQTHFRVGLSVGKKVGNAVTRNAVKRKIRQALLEEKGHIRPTIDFIIIARPQAANLTMSEVKKNIEHVLKVAKIYEIGQ
ncbi:MAG: ribonuclease P protein component [Lactobacillales bacterium]|jgi:ribonuclease P protein component|nr:ribonuclease P protein component [Lactobacillales bacterium]